jgi:eukaryotic-like serine/threonine-protein kinase
MSDNTGRLNAALEGRYRIERELGAGGMAIVYLAEDVKHKRKVALKVLKPELAAVLGADRFVQEITTTASLQHPHILPLFDSGTADGFLFYVMPFIEGETLRDKLNRETQLGVDEAVRIAREVADALNYAHGKGVIHRDIKPENILIQNGRPMVADFGIALAVSAAAGGRMTETGLSLGTPHYMSPEQATADKEITGRSDVYSLASVLYEMLAGQPPHLGGSAQQIIMKIIAEPVQPVTALRKSVPPNVAAALAKALEKLPADRFDSARAFSDSLQNTGYTFNSATAGPMRRGSQPWNPVSIGLTALSMLLALALGLTVLKRPVPATQAPIRFALTADDSLRVESGSTRPFAISPDGQSIVFRASRDSIGSRLWIRTLGDPTARPIEGTQDGMNAAFSPDGEWIAFITENVNVKKVRVTGGSVSPIVHSQSRTAALTWGDDNEIFLEQIGPNDGIHRVSASGGRMQLTIPLDSAKEEVSQRRPFFIPGTGTIVYASTTNGGGEPTLVLYRSRDNRRQPLDLPGIGAIGFVENHLIYSRSDGTLMAVELDVDGMAARTAPVALEPRVAASGTGSSVAFSMTGTLVYRDAEGVNGSSIALMDTAGQVRAIRGGYSVQVPLRFSPDGRHIAVGSRIETVVGGSGAADSPDKDVRVIDLDTQISTRLRTRGSAQLLSWTADGKRLVAPARPDSGVITLMAVPLDGAPETSLVSFAARSVSSSSPLPDGLSHVLVALFEGSNKSSLIRVWVNGSGRIDTLVSEGRDGVSPFMPRVSPDGRLVAFQERRNGDVYVQSIAGGGVLQVSGIPAGFQRPVVWGADSRRLYYGNANGLNTVVIETSPSLRVVRQAVKVGLAIGQNYDVHPDGKTFIVVNPFTRDSDVQVTVNWLQSMRRMWTGRNQ